MNGGWLCDACHSLNKSRDTRCYSCRVPRRAVEHQAGGEQVVRGTALEAPPTPIALAVRGGARYRPTWILVLVLVPMVIAVSILDALLWPDLIAQLRVDGSFAGDPRSNEVLGRFALEMGAMVAAGALWAVWMAGCLGNIPALTGQWPGFGTSDALLAPLGRRSSYYRPMQVMREIVDSFAEGRTWPGLLVTAWWAAWIGSIVIPGAIGLVRLVLGGRGMRPMLEPILLRPVFLAVAAVLAIAVLSVVEWLQHRARLALPTMAATGLPASPVPAPAAPTPSPAVPVGPVPAAPAPDVPTARFEADDLRPGATPPRPPRQGRDRRRRTGAVVGVGLAVVAVIAVALVGSGVLSPGSTDQAPRTAETSTATTPPMPVPTMRPSDAPVEHPVVARLLAYAHDRGASGRWETRTEIAARNWTTETARVEVARSGAESWVRTWTLQPSGEIGVVGETALMHGMVYRRASTQPWDELTPEPGDVPPVVVGVEPWDQLIYEGRVRRDGERLHRIGFERYGVEAIPVFEQAFADHAGVATKSVGWVLVREDGTPVVLAARVDGEIDGGTPAVLRMVTTFRDMGTGVRISLGGMPPPVR